MICYIRLNFDSDEKAILISIGENVQGDIYKFLENYFAENGLSKTDENVRYLEHNFVENDVEEKRKLLSGEMRAVFKIRAWLDAQELEPLGEGGILVLADQYGQAFAVVKVADIEIVKYKDVSQKLARSFMIGDGSVESWKDCCHDFLNLECGQLKVDFNADTEILVTWIDLIYPHH